MFKYIRTIVFFAVGIASLVILLLLFPLPNKAQCSGATPTSCTHSDPDSPESTPVQYNEKESLRYQRFFQFLLFACLATVDVNSNKPTTGKTHA